MKYRLLYNIEDQSKYLGNLYTYVPMFMNYLWENPIIVSKLIINSKKEDVQKYIGPLIINNFYENILSSSYLEDHLLYVISLVLKNEIDNEIKQKNDYLIFLEETSCGIFLDQLKIKQDVQTYFKTLIYKIVSHLEEENSSYEFNFNIKNIQEEFNKTREDIESEYNRTGKKKRIITSNFFRNNNYNYDFETINENEEKNISQEIFTVKYIPSLNHNEYKKLMEKNEKNKIMNDFFLSQYQISKENSNIFSNDTFLNNIFKCSQSKEVLASYQIDFIKVIKILDEILKSFFNYLYLLPYSVKCICKMIILMIRKKFSDLNIVDQNAYISKFFINKLFVPIFENPGKSAFINNFIISEVTQKNLKIISLIIQQIFSGKLFKDGWEKGDYTPFNWYIIDRIQEIYKFYDNLTQVNLPPFIEKLINNELPKSYKYNYFKENPENEFFHRSICFSFKDLCVILNNMKDLKDKLFISEETRDFQKTFEKLINKLSIAEFERIQKNIEYDIIKVIDPKNKKEIKEIKGYPILHYFLISKLLTNQKYTKIFNITQETSSYTLKELPKTEDENNKKNNIIKVKNFLCSLLNNYRTLVKTDFIENTTYNTFSILKQLKTFMKISNFIIDGSIPSEWYVDSLLEYLKKIPPDLTNNDCDILYKQIESHLNASIKDIDFEALSIILSRIKFCKRRKNNYEKMKTLLIDIKLNEKVQYIIEKEPIAVEIKFNYNNNKNKELRIEKSNKRDIQLKSLDNLMIEEETQTTYYCRTIKAFTKRFPDIARLQQIIEKDLTEIEKELKLSQKVNNYFNIIKEFLMSKNNSINNLKNLDEISNKIYDYVMEKLYDKIFPKTPDPLDIAIYNQCQLLSWTEPKHYMQTKTNLVFDSFLPDVINYFKEINIQKSPRQKIIYMNKIFQSITNVVKFSGGGEIGIDDIMPILNYALIKAKPVHIYSNCKYIELFIGEKKNKEEGIQLVQLMATCQFAQNITPDKLYGITNEQFYRKCKTVKF